MRFVLLVLFWLSTVGSGLAQDGWFMPTRSPGAVDPVREFGGMLQRMELSRPDTIDT